jgi:hypothetical protein
LHFVSQVKIKTKVSKRFLRSAKQNSKESSDTRA